MKLERTLGALGITLWVAVDVFRYDILLNNLLGRSFINILPNFAAVWLMYYFVIELYYYIAKKRLPKGVVSTCIVAAILCLLIFWENAAFFHLEAFDVLDIVASCVAAILVLIFTAIRNKKSQDSLI